MAINIEALINRINELILFAERVSFTRQNDEFRSFVDSGLFNEFRSSSLSFLRNTFGEEHPFYMEFNARAKEDSPFDVEDGTGVLKAAKQEIEGGWLFTIKGIVSAEIFSDFLEMAEYLLIKKYKDAAAVIIGSVLEEHLRQLCTRNSIDTHTIKSGKSNPKKADLLNSELAKNDVYNKLDQKSVTSWLDLRNKAAHGLYSGYTIEQVGLMYQGVLNFIARTR